MKIPQKFVWTAAGFSAGRVFRAPLLPATPLSRADLPVVSNHAFISAWRERRDKLAAMAQLAPKN